MKKLVLSLGAASALLMSGCIEHYNQYMVDRVEDLENRVTTLEDVCQRMNTNVLSLQTLVNALTESDAITSVSPVSEDGRTVGYVMNFLKNSPITIYHGKDGKDGANGADGTTPLLGVKQDGGHYYWTLNGSWLTDDKGNKVSAEGVQGASGSDGAAGASGKDGVTPRFHIDGGDWYISLDNGTTWEKAGRATGEKGEAGKDGADGKDGINGQDGAAGKDGEAGKDGVNGKDGADGKDGINGQDGAAGKDGEAGKDGADAKEWFTKIDTESDAGSVTFELADGESFTIPRSPELAIEFIGGDEITLTGGSTDDITVDYKIIGKTVGLKLNVITSANVRASLSSENDAEGTLTITPTDATSGYDKVILFATNGNATVMNSLSFK